MYLRKLFFVVSIFFLISLNANALTVDDCQKRAMNAYDNAAAVGGTDADMQKLGSYAANECFKEIEAQKGGSTSSNSGSTSSNSGSTSSSSGSTSSSSGSGSSSSSDGGFGAILVLLLGGGFVAYKVYAPHPATHREVRKAFAKINSAFAENATDHELIKTYKAEGREEQKNGMEYMLKTMKTSDWLLTQYDMKEMVDEAIGELSRIEKEVLETGKIAPKFARKTCRTCKTVNKLTDDKCVSCGAALLTVEQMSEISENFDQSQRLERTFRREQIEAKSRGLEEFAILIEQRAKRAGYVSLANVAKAYCSGEIGFHGLPFFGEKEAMNAIWLYPDVESISTTDKFPINRSKALMFAMDSVEKLVDEKYRKKLTKKQIGDFKLNIAVIAELFLKTDGGDHNWNVKSELYRSIADERPDLFSRLQDLIILCDKDYFANDLGKQGQYNEFPLLYTLRGRIPNFELIPIDRQKEIEKEILASAEELRNKRAQKNKSKKTPNPVAG